MATVYIPAQLRDLTGDAEVLEVTIPQDEHLTVRAVLARLEANHPGLEARLLEADGGLNPYLAVFIDGEQAGLGLSARVKDDQQVYFLTPVAGGNR